MDNERLSQGDKAYAAGDWRAAAREYLAAAQGSDAVGAGRAYHMSGNALMRLRRNSDAATVYGHALKDESYDKRAAVLTNLGVALAADGRYSEALESSEAALAEPGNDAPWKAQQCKAGALYDMGRFEDAAQAYREASWIEGNPDPGRSLNNLGMCFMTLGRPEDAVEAFKAAIAVDGYAGKGRSSANLGLSYAAMGFHEEAVRAFEAALGTYSYHLTGATLAAYEAAKSATGPQASGEMVEGWWSTGEMPPVAEGAEGDVEPAGPATIEDTRFFTMTEDQMRAEGREASKAQRRQKRSGRGLAIRIWLAVLLVALVAGGVAAVWYFGLGYPTQTATVSDMIDAYRQGGRVAQYWVAVPATDVEREMRTLPARFASYSVAAVHSGPSESTVRVTVKLEKSGTQDFSVSLVREGVGWKVNGVRNDWRSTGGGS